MRIKKHDKSYIVELEDGSAWRIWPGDLAKTLHWVPSTRLMVHEIDGEFCTHALFDRLHYLRPRHRRGRTLARGKHREFASRL